MWRQRGGPRTRRPRPLLALLGPAYRPSPRCSRWVRRGGSGRRRRRHPSCGCVRRTGKPASSARAAVRRAHVHTGTRRTTRGHSGLLAQSSAITAVRSGRSARKQRVAAALRVSAQAIGAALAVVFARRLLGDLVSGRSGASGCTGHAGNVRLGQIPDPAAHLVGAARVAVAAVPLAARVSRRRPARGASDGVGRERDTLGQLIRFHDLTISVE